MPCLKRCMNDVQKSDLELNIVKTVDYANYFLNLDKICNIISEARECIENCQIESNPFALRSMTIMCTPAILEQTKKYTQCMKEEGETVKSVCERQCGDINEVNEKIDTATKQLNSENKPNKEKFNEIMLNTNKACGMTKCYARCSRNNFASACHHLGQEEVGEFLFAFVDAVNDAMVQDIEEQKLLETMSKSSPPQCNYMYARGVLFDKVADDAMLRSIVAKIRHPNQAISKSSSIPERDDELKELQRQVLLKEMNVLEKHERLLEKESYKLDMDLALTANNNNF
ncbi:unnamed protein product [Anisakis simplex]|uniref:CPG4 domain-containing protein n=1 Tax=Anisakis simplex TaxID=6269 RepID=A0A0M3KBJ1_ANISI|nr:unnamed protein product [Anisakis simplex]